MRLSLLVLFVALAGGTYAQSGSLIIDIVYYDYERQVDMSLYKGADLIDSTSMDYGKYERDSLEQGSYQVNIYSESTEIIERNVEIYDDSTTYIQVTLSFQETYSNGRSKDWLEEGVLKFDYNQGKFEGNSVYKRAIGFGLESKGMRLFNRVGLGMLAGWDYYQARINSDTTFSPLKPHKVERYDYLNMNFGLFGKFYFAKPDEYSPGIAIEAGIKYKLPVYFRYISKGGTNVYHRKQIHRFNDVVATAALSFNWFQLFAEYRLMDYVRGEDYPQLLKFRFGIALSGLVD